MSQYITQYAIRTTSRLALLLAVLLLAACGAQPDGLPATPVVVAENPARTPRPTLAPTETPAPSPSPTPTPTPSQTPTPTPSLTPTESPTPTPAPAPVLRQLTSGECCTQPFWSPDSQQVWFIDKPAPNQPVGFWGVDARGPMPEPRLITDHIAFYARDFSHLVEVVNGRTFIERVADGARWTVPAGGRSVSFSPQVTRIAWSISPAGAPVERRVTQVWVANLDGSDARQVASLPRGGLGGWLDDDRLLLSGAASLQSRSTRMLVHDLTTGEQVLLVDEERVRGALPSPGGRWLVFFIAQNPQAEKNGLWLAATDGSELRQLDRDLFGAYQWRDAQRLLLIPFRPDATFHQVLELDVATGALQALTDADVTPFKIANGDWQAAPDGHAIVFVESRDKNIWVLELP